MNESGENTVAVATVWLDDVPPGAARVLSSGELARAKAMRDDRRRARFVAGRASLRELLATLTGAEPSGLAFDYGASGKPVLRPTTHITCAPLHFSVTHSGGLALIAVTRMGPVGIDVERLREIPRAAAIARRVLGESEAAALTAMHGAERDAHFLRLWTRWEAVVKATGGSIWSAARPARHSVVQSITTEPDHTAAIALLGAKAHGDWLIERVPIDMVRYRDPERV